MSDRKSYRPVTKETVIMVRSKLNDPRYATLNLDDIGCLCDTSGTTVSRIKNGRYDYLLEEKESCQSDDNKIDCLSLILEELKRNNELLERLVKGLNV